MHPRTLGGGARWRKDLLSNMVAACCFCKLRRFQPSAGNARALDQCAPRRPCSTRTAPGPAGNLSLRLPKFAQVNFNASPVGPSPRIRESS